MKQMWAQDDFRIGLEASSTVKFQLGDDGVTVRMIDSATGSAQECRLLKQVSWINSFEVAEGSRRRLLLGKSRQEEWPRLESSGGQRFTYDWDMEAAMEREAEAFMSSSSSSCTSSEDEELQRARQILAETDPAEDEVTTAQEMKTVHWGGIIVMVTAVVVAVLMGHLLGNFNHVVG